MAKPYTTLEYRDPADLERQLLEKLDLTPLRQLWETEEAGTKKEFEVLAGKSCFMTLAPEAGDDGFFAVTLHHYDPRKRDKSWPRHYFDRHRARQEAEAWMVVHGQLALPPQTPTKDAE